VVFGDIPLTADQVGKLHFELDAHLQLFGHLRLGNRSGGTVDDLEAERELVRFPDGFQFALLLSQGFGYDCHLLLMSEDSFVVIRRYASVHEHRSKLRIHDVVGNHAVDAIVDIVPQARFIIDKTFEPTSDLVEASPCPGYV
jgi:hypothetical protein